MPVTTHAAYHKRFEKKGSKAALLNPGIAKNDVSVLSRLKSKIVAVKRRNEWPRTVKKCSETILMLYYGAERREKA